MKVRFILSNQIEDILFRFILSNQIQLAIKQIQL